MKLAAAVHISSEFTGRVQLTVFPDLLEKLIDCRHGLSADLPELSRLIRMDPALCFMALRLAHTMEPADAQVRPTGIEAAVDRIGMAGVDLILSQALADQAVDGIHRQRGLALEWLWRNALTTALLAGDLAMALDYQPVEEAYVAGLLLDIGKLALFSRTPAACTPMLADADEAVALLEAETQVVGSGHDRIGAHLIRQHTSSWSAADAAAYHTATAADVAQAFPLVRIVWSAKRLAAEPSPSSETLKAVANLLRLDVERLVRLSLAAQEQTRKMRNKLGEASEALPENRPVSEKTASLARPLRIRMLLSSVYGELLQARDHSAILRLLRQSLSVFLGIEALAVFKHDTGKNCLALDMAMGVASPAAIERMQIPLAASDCLPVACHTGAKAVDSFSQAQANRPTIMDRQLIAAMGKEGFLCLPLLSDSPRACLLLGIDDADWPWIQQQTTLLKAIAAAVDNALAQQDLRSGRPRARSMDGEKQASARTRKIVHEINNPLGIIKNYLKVLSRRTDQEAAVADGIRIIDEEINRVATLVRSLTAPPEKLPGHRKGVDVNAEIKDILSMLRDSLAGKTILRFDQDLDPHLPQIDTDRDRLKQALINLLKNAMEAMPDGGTITVKTRKLHGRPRHPDRSPEKSWLKISICDDGPGINEEIQNTLFDPHVTSKNGHDGLGLAIVQEAMSDLNGFLLCESVPGRGACFHMEIPESGDGT
ncbi:HDOD domain-containing protein [uncultured Desulfosarcina sp.]|uniref:HDOD domain-containing protein n=1 Tax=uncultured Desulfosarcina sp. TaxID=218289 RepID=UPI0029C92203|nr:HDOD domain-containing protein [uncultured Desulfosarcina sp.]